MSNMKVTKIVQKHLLYIILTYGQYETWAMGHMDKGVSWLMLQIEMGHLGDGAHGQWGTTSLILEGSSPKI